MRSTSSPRAERKRMGTRCFCADAAADLEAVELGEHDVEHHQVDAARVDGGDGRGAVGDAR